MKILMTGGGTAGHVTPNIALVYKLRRDGHTLSYIGTNDGIEKELIENEKIDFYPISAGKLRRYLSKENLSDISKTVKGFKEASKHLRAIKPDVVFSKGGFVSCPVVWAAWYNNIPVIIHESDLTPGLANKLSIPFAKKVCYSFPLTRKHLPKKKSVFTGIPIRKELLAGNKKIGVSLCNFTNEKRIILVIGGSSGSKAINRIIRSSLDNLLAEYQVCHICGKGSIDESLLGKTGYAQFEYVGSELKDLICMSDLVISRAGATTLYELLNMFKPNILIPLPKAQSRGDQLLNAAFFKTEGYSEMLLEESITEDILMDTINSVIREKRKYIDNMKKSVIRNSEDLVIDVINKELKK